MNKKLYISLLLIFSFFFVKAQDIHFSMFYKTPLLLNPANTGNFNGKWRINSSYRKQGDFISNPFSTNILSFDMPVYYFKRIGSIGFSIINDRTADNTLNSNIFSFSTAHFIKISDYSYLHMGFSFALANKIISPNSLSFPNQFDNSIGKFNPNLNNAENLKTYKASYIDLSWGFMWTKILPKLKFQLGIAMFHYNKPYITFALSSRLFPKYQFHAYFEKNITKKFFLKPKILYSYENHATELLIGNEFGMTFNNNSLKKLYTGIFFRGGFVRNPSATIFSIGFLIKNFNLNFSYDYSFLKKEFPKDATLEISIFYTMPHLQIEKRAIQCEIF